MINYLSIYPIQLPARYRDRVACYNTVYITSNLPIDRQYISVQEDAPDLWKDFTMHIHKVIEFTANGEINGKVLNEIPIIEN